MLRRDSAKERDSNCFIYLCPLHDAIPLHKRGSLHWVLLGGPVKEVFLRYIGALVNTDVELDKRRHFSAD